ncbi:uncharacterized protein PAC_02676 [Phialocephala subalpina]|uniref:NB-ARC domain-containing protein n=1 Tax=Phialocephala subalpina TaxID=576137 RepID=A0A1L7WJ40_9HELO|nr:uncharacterized protein PAC_02676 [Phialocephala subalpina]
MSSTETEVVGALTETVAFSSTNYGLQVGFNKGHIVVNYHNQLQEIEKAEPCSTVPFEKDEDFIGRESILKEIKKRLSPGSGQHRRVALVGHGGVGKSQIAVEYATRLREKDSKTWAFWIHASTAADFTYSYRQIAEAAKIPRRDDPKVDILDLTSRWLESNGPWLIVLDNCDDAELFFKPLPAPGPDELYVQKRKTLSDYLPRAPNGIILITTRDHRAGSRLCGAKPSIDVDRMDPSEAKELCFRKLQDQEIDEETLDTLLTKLEYLPLAITQAIAFISENGSTVQHYLKLLESESKKLLSKDIEDRRRYPGVPHSVMNTWRVSFDMIKEREPRAADMLSQMCFFNRQEIQRRLLVGEDGGGMDFTTALGTLKSYRFITADKEDTSFEMHALVQLATRLWIEDENETEKYSALALKSVSGNFPAGDFEDRLLCEKLLLHAKAVLEYKQTKREDQLNNAELLHNTAWYAAEQGNFRDAEKWLEEAVNIRQEHLGVGESATLYSMNNLAMAYSDMGKPKDAVKLQERVVELINTKEGGENNPDSLEAMSQLANMYLALGMWSQAESLGKRVVENSEAAEEEEEDVLRRKISLAEIYKDTGKHKLAQGLAEAVVQRLQEMVSEDKERLEEDADTDDDAFPSPTLIAMLAAMQTLAMIYRDQGKLEKAAKIGKQVMDTRTKRLGDKHPSTLDITSDMALIYEDQGQFEEAQRLGAWIVGTSETLLGAEHPSTLSSIINLTSVLEKMGQLEKAESLGKTVVKASTSILGESHRTSLLSMGNLASIYRSRGKLEDAAELGRRVLKMRKDTLEKNHPDVLMGVTNLALTYHKKGSFVEMRETLLSVQEPQSITICGIHTTASVSPTLPPTLTMSGIHTAASISPVAPPRKIFTIDRAVEVVLLLALFLYYWRVEIGVVSMDS